jgi:hypothetical protein
MHKRISNNAGRVNYFFGFHFFVLRLFPGTLPPALSQARRQTLAAALAHHDVLRTKRKLRP